MAVLTVTYSANTAITLDLSSLLDSPTFVAGVESDEINNTANMYVDALVDIKPITAGAGTNTIGQEMRVYCWGSDVSLATTTIGTLDGANGAETVTVETLAALRLAASCAAIAVTADLVYYLQPFSVAALFGGIMPKFWGLFFVHSMSGDIAAAMSGKFQYTGVKYST